MRKSRPAWFGKAGDWRDFVMRRDRAVHGTDPRVDGAVDGNQGFFAS